MGIELSKVCVRILKGLSRNLNFPKKSSNSKAVDNNPENINQKAIEVKEFLLSKIIKK